MVRPPGTIKVINNENMTELDSFFKQYNAAGYLILRGTACYNNVPHNPLHLPATNQFPLEALPTSFNKFTTYFTPEVINSINSSQIVHQFRRNAQQVQRRLPPPPPPPPPPPNVTLFRNMSKVEVPVRVQELLNLGRNFVFPQDAPLLRQALMDLAENARRCRFAVPDREAEDEEVRNRTNSNTNELPRGCNMPSAYYPPASKIAALERYLASMDVEITAALEHQDVKPMSKDVKTLLNFASCPDIVIKEADKSQILCIINTDDYKAEAQSERHLGDVKTYMRVPTPANETLGLLKETVHHFLHSSLEELQTISQEASSLLTDTLGDLKLTDGPKGKAFKNSLLLEDARLGLLYLNPKLHKEAADTQHLPLGCPCRPIISMVAHPVAPLAAMVHALLAPALSREFIKDYLQDTPDLLRQMETIRQGEYELPDGCSQIDENSNVFSLDVVAMYTNIDWKRGARATAKLWQAWKMQYEPMHPITEVQMYNLVLFIMSNVYFQFGEEVYRQIFGFAMGNSSAIVVGNAFMGDFFEEFDKGNPQFKPSIPFKRRFLDDVLGFANMTVEKIEEYVETLNAWSAGEGWGIQFKISGMGKSVPYLDTEVYLKDGAWHTKLYAKATNLHAYLHPRSFHPRHITSNIPMMVAFRIRRICSEDSEFFKAARLFTDLYFARRGYSKEMVAEAFRIAGARSRCDLLVKKPKRKLQEGILAFPFTYALNPNVDAILKRLYPILSSDPRTAPRFSGPQIVAYKKGQSIKDIMVRAALLRQVPLRGCHLCKNLQCPLHDARVGTEGRILYEGDSVYSFRYQTTYKIRGSFSCTSRHVVYAITCLRCEQQGVGECIDPLRRALDHVRAAQVDTPTAGCAIERHFQDASHGPKDICFQIIDGVPKQGHSLAGVRAVRVRLENIWIRRLIGTREGGLNIRCQWYRSMAGGSQNQHQSVIL